jgi:hypothetical protein
VDVVKDDPNPEDAALLVAVDAVEGWGVRPPILSWPQVRSLAQQVSLGAQDRAVVQETAALALTKRIDRILISEGALLPAEGKAP